MGGVSNDGLSVNPMSQTAEYSRLRRIARGLIRNECACTLTATELVHELLIKERRLAADSPAESDHGQETVEPLPFASRMMKQILIDRAERRKTRKNSEDQAKARISGQGETDPQFFVDLDDAVNLMGTTVPLNAELVRLHLYAELSIADAADKLGISRATAHRKWAFFKTWLASRINSQS